MKKGIHCFVKGKVQGVWFRASTKDEAMRLGITGWVRNLSDGRVEVMAYGEPEKLNQLHEWLKIGPSKAQVDDLVYQETEWVECEEFEIV